MLLRILSLTLLSLTSLPRLFCMASTITYRLVTPGLYPKLGVLGSFILISDLPANLSTWISFKYLQFNVSKNNLS